MYVLLFVCILEDYSFGAASFETALLSQTNGNGNEFIRRLDAYRRLLGLLLMI